jgi:hypothetical protein
LHTVRGAAARDAPPLAVLQSRSAKKTKLDILLYMHTLLHMTPLECMATLYRQSFETFGDTALRNMTPMPDPKPAHALAVIYNLRSYGDSRAWQLANELNEAREAVVKSGIAP